MIIVYLLIIASFVSFLFLPTVTRVFNIPINQPDNAVAVTVRYLTNFRFFLICKVQKLLMMSPANVGKIDKIFVYPIKSVSYIQPPTWEVNEHGLKHDRQYLLAFWDEKAQVYQAYTQRNAPRLTLVKTTYNLEENWFEFSYPDAEDSTTTRSFRLPCDVTDEFLEKNLVTSEKNKADLWGVKFQSLNVGRAIPDEFKKSMNLNRDGTTLLVSMGKKVKTAHPKELGGVDKMREVLFQDYYPLHLISQTEVDELNQRIKDSGSSRFVEPLQFRPNFVIDQSQAQSKISPDYWFDTMLNDKYRLFVVQKTPRCSIGNVILSKGEVDKTSIVTKTLNKYRRVDPGEVNYSFLGVYAIHQEHGYKVSVGDEITLVQKKLSTYLQLT